MRPKDLPKGQEMPTDFWNYKVNPIVGYYVEPREKNPRSNYKKYGITPSPLKP